MNLKFIDTDQERSIDLGVSWPFSKLAPSECIISADFSSKGISVGDEVFFELSWTDFWNNLGMNGYNPQAELNAWPIWEHIDIAKEK